jgi:hypothetical protein
MLVMLLLLQHGLASATLITGNVMQSADESTAAAVHECAGMDMQFDTSTTNDLQHSKIQHEECIEAGCGNCVGCATFTSSYRSPVLSFVTSRAAALPVYLSPPVLAPDLLYRPPIHH